MSNKGDGSRPGLLIDRFLIGEDFASVSLTKPVARIFQGRKTKALGGDSVGAKIQLKSCVLRVSG